MTRCMVIGNKFVSNLLTHGSVRLPHKKHWYYSIRFDVYSGLEQQMSSTRVPPIKELGCSPALSGQLEG